MVVPIGLESLALKELQEWTAILATEWGSAAFLIKVELVKGGVEFRVGREVGWVLNHVLKLPSRILERIAQFTTREKNVFQTEMQKVSWREWFPLGIAHWEIAASESKMNNEKHLLEWIETHLRGKAYSANEQQGWVAYLRVHNNQFTLSRDLSGEHLHFRGYRKNQGEAPLRENFAAALWGLLLQYRSPHDLQESVVIDPFVGSGTLLFEGLLWNRFVKTRSFPADALIESSQKQRLLRIEANLIKWAWSMRGVDIDSGVLAKARENLKEMALSPKEKIELEFICENSCDSSSDNRAPSWLPVGKPVILISNPPYGGQGRLRSKDPWGKIWEGALKRYSPELAIGIGPEREVKKGMRLGVWECSEVIRFLNGGLRVATSVWIRKEGSKKDGSKKEGAKSDHGGNGEPKVR